MKLFVFILLAGATALAQNPPKGSAIPLPVEGNPFVDLYRLRVKQAELNLDRQTALQSLASARLDRGRRLIASRAMSAEEFDVLTSEAAVTTADRALAVKRVEESKTYLRIIEELVKRGVGIPLCTTETE